MTTLKQANRAIANARIPLELERGDGYHYFIYDVPSENIYETVSVYVPYTNAYSLSEWVDQAEYVFDHLKKTLDDRRYYEEH